MPTVRSALPSTGLCDCGHDAVFHDERTGPCDYHPDPMVSECPCFEFHESPRYVWTGPHAELARILERAPGVPAFFIFDGGTSNVLFDAPIDVRAEGFRAWCRTGPLPDDLADLASRALEDDAVAMVYLDALLERDLARAATGDS